MSSHPLHELNLIVKPHNDGLFHDIDLSVRRFYARFFNIFFPLHQVAPKIKAMMMESGATMVGYQPQGNKVNFFRMVVSNPAATQSDIDFLIDEIERLGHDL